MKRKQDDNKEACAESGTMFCLKEVHKSSQNVPERSCRTIGDSTNYLTDKPCVLEGSNEETGGQMRLLLSNPNTDMHKILLPSPC